MKLEDDRLVISLDFGTTYSGVAYAFNIPGKKADVVSILDWPGKSFDIRRCQKRVNFMSGLEKRLGKSLSGAHNLIPETPLVSGVLFSLPVTKTEWLNVPSLRIE